MPFPVFYNNVENQTLPEKLGRERMKIGLSTLLFPRYSLEKAVEVCAELGAEWVEIIWDFPHFAPGCEKPDLQRIGRIIRDAGLEISVHASFWDINPASIIPEVRKTAVKRIKSGIEVCAKLDGGPVVLHAGKCPIPEVEWMWRKTGEIYEKTMREVCAFAKRLNVKIAVENGSSAFGPYAVLEELPELLKKFDVGICLDIGHAYLVERRRSKSPEKKIAEKIEKLCEKIVHVHVHDNRGFKDDHLVPGEGEIDFKPIVAAFWKIDYSGALIVELFNPDEPEKIGKKGISEVRKLFRKS